MSDPRDMWLATDTTEDTGAFSASFWDRHRADLAAGRFWAEEIKGLRGDPAARLRKALKNLPLPGAFRHAAIATRALIRVHRKAGTDPGRELRLLYWLAAIESFGVPYSQRCECPGYNILESVPAAVLNGLEFDYPTLGHEQLMLLNKTDRKWLADAWGEPRAHTTLHQLHHQVWRQYEDAYAGRRREELEALFGSTAALALNQYGDPSPAPWWKRINAGDVLLTVCLGGVALFLLALFF